MRSDFYSFVWNVDNGIEHSKESNKIFIFNIKVNMEKPNEYTIETINDIIEIVPAEKLDLFLQDLKIFILEWKAFKNVMDKMPEAVRWNIKLNMKWVDDWDVGLRWTEVNVQI